MDPQLVDVARGEGEWGAQLGFQDIQPEVQVVKDGITTPERNLFYGTSKITL